MKNKNIKLIKKFDLNSDILINSKKNNLKKRQIGDKLPISMQKQFKELGLGYLIMNIIERTYLQLIRYQSKGLIDYYISQNGKPIYSTKPFKRKKKQLIEQYKDIEGFIIHSCENDCTDTYTYLSIPHPSLIIKDFEEKLPNNDEILKRKIIEILIGKRRIQKRSEQEKDDLRFKNEINKLLLQKNK